jgi:hypothetical protein|tara:strand:- start:515 stop:685 length:171 start_codon:yes stop_codon:yes gene_type:complete
MEANRELLSAATKSYFKALLRRRLASIARAALSFELKHSSRAERLGLFREAFEKNS